LAENCIKLAFCNTGSPVGGGIRNVDGFSGKDIGKRELLNFVAYILTLFKLYRAWILHILKLANFNIL
jgi:hypothetical protein